MNVILTLLNFLVVGSGTSLPNCMVPTAAQSRVHELVFNDLREFLCGAGAACGEVEIKQYLRETSVYGGREAQTEPWRRGGMAYEEDRREGRDAQGGPRPPP